MAWKNKKKAFPTAFIKNEEVGCGIAPGFGLKEYNRYNSIFKGMLEKYPEFGIDQVLFTLFGEEEIKHMVHITTRLNDSADEEKTNTVLDSRMGVYQRDRVCGTCCQTSESCPGHYGYIKLPIPIVHPLFFGEVRRILRAICHNCGNVIASPDGIRSKRADKLGYASKIGASARRCNTCKHVNPIIGAPVDVKAMTDEGEKSKLIIDLIPSRLFTYKDIKSDSPTILSIEKTEHILRKTTPEARRLLSFHDTPLESMVMKVLIVPPLQVRPVVRTGNVEENNQLTSMYDYILKVNNKIVDGEIDPRNRNWMYNLIGRLLDKKEPSIKSLGLFKSLKEMISKKSGLIRSNAVGKRMNYASRTVLSPAAEACLGEVSYPSNAADDMTIPVQVTEYNYDYLLEKWNLGRLKTVTPYTPGHPKFGRAINYHNEELHIGDIVTKNLESGDMVVFNRQPTLDKYSLLAQQALIVERNTKVNGINSCATKPANADFDGDEGNMYIMQTLESQAEARYITNIRRNIVSSSTSNPIVSIQYHGVVGLYRLTDDITIREHVWNDAFETFWDNREAFIPIGFHGKRSRTESNPAANNALKEDFFRRIKKSGIEPLSGSALFSSLLPATLYYRKGKVLVEEGILVRGQLSKKDIGGSSKGLVHTLQLMFGGETTSNFLSSAQKMADWYNKIAPTSLGLYHLNPNIVENDLLLQFVRQNVLDSESDLVNEYFLGDIHKAYDGSLVSEAADSFVRRNKTALDERATIFGLDRPFVKPIKSVVQESAAIIEHKVKKLLTWPNMTRSDLEDRERNIFGIIGRQDSDTKKYGKLAIQTGTAGPMGLMNPLVILQESGAKGSESNLMQMTTSIGQTIVYDERHPYNTAPTVDYKEGTRTSLFFTRKGEPNFVETIQSRGYINASYVQGTSPSHFMFAMTSERVGVIKSRITTALSGYFSRQIIKFSDELHVASNGSVNNMQNRVVSFTYSDGFDASKIVMSKTPQNGDFYGPLDPSMIAKKKIMEHIRMVETK